MGPHSPKRRVELSFPGKLQAGPARRPAIDHESAPRGTCAATKGRDGIGAAITASRSAGGGRARVRAAISFFSLARGPPVDNRRYHTDLQRGRLIQCPPPGKMRRYEGAGADFAPGQQRAAAAADSERPADPHALPATAQPRPQQRHAASFLLRASRGRRRCACMDFLRETN